MAIDELYDSFIDAEHERLNKLKSKRLRSVEVKSPQGAWS